jgi:hypothetical protein
MATGEISVAIPNPSNLLMMSEGQYILINNKTTRLQLLVSTFI